MLCKCFACGISEKKNHRICCQLFFHRDAPVTLRLNGQVDTLLASVSIYRSSDFTPLFYLPITRSPPLLFVSSLCARKLHCSRTCKCFLFLEFRYNLWTSIQNRMQIR